MNNVQSVKPGQKLFTDLCCPTKIIFQAQKLICLNLKSSWIIFDLTFNVGAIFRTSDGAGISKVHLCGITPPPTHHKVHKTALGAETRIAYEKHPNTLELVQKLKEAGKRIWALEKTDASIPINQVKLEINDPETVLVVGNEVIGIDPDVLEICDCQMHIPMAGIKNSLNVAVAFGIAVYNLVDKYNFLENTSIN